MAETGRESKWPPLTWPEYWRNPSALQRLLKGVPHIGIDRRLEREIVAQLQARGPECLEAWDADAQVRRIVSVAGEIIVKNLKRPNGYFIPDDLFGMMVFDPGDGLNTVEVLLDLEDAFGLAMETLDERTWEMTFGEVVQRIRREGRAAAEKGAESSG